MFFLFCRTFCFLSYSIWLVLLCFVLVACSPLDEPIPNPFNPTKRGDIVSYTVAELYPATFVTEINRLLGDVSTELSEPFEMSITSNVLQYTIVYKTEDGKGALVDASAAVFIGGTIGAITTHPLLSFNHGTIYSSLTQSPTVTSLDLNTVLTAPVESYHSAVPGSSYAILFAAAGYVVVIPDDVGFGVSEAVHPYMHGKSLSNSTLDAIRAVKLLSSEDGVNFLLNEKLFISGYSGGGYSAMATFKTIDQDSALSSEFLVTAVATVAAPLNLSEGMFPVMMLDQTPYANFLPYVMVSYNSVYDFYTDPADYFDESYLDVPAMFDGMHTSSDISERIATDNAKMMLTVSVRELLQTTPNESVLYQKLVENDIYNWIPSDPAKVRIYHLEHDDVVPSVNATSFSAVSGVEVFDPTNGADVRIEGSSVPGLESYHGAGFPYCMAAIKTYFDSLK